MRGRLQRGRDVMFGEGQYVSYTVHGMKLLV